MNVNLKRLTVLVISLLSLTACQTQTGPGNNQPNQVKPNIPMFDDYAFGNGAGYMRGGMPSNPNSGMPMNNGSGVGIGQGAGPGQLNNGIIIQQLDTIKAAESLSDQEKNDLLFMREEEKVARDFYIFAYDKWKQKSFDNISKSEQFHMDAIKLLLDRYKIEDPIGTNANGIFKDKKLQDLYDGLIKDANISLEASLKLGAKVEEIDIRDLKASINNTKAEDLKFVYDTLMSASENHLRAFTSNLTKFYNTTYTPQVLSKEDFDKIVK